MVATTQHLQHLPGPQDLEGPLRQSISAVAPVFRPGVKGILTENHAALAAFFGGAKAPRSYGKCQYNPGLKPGAIKGCLKIRYFFKNCVAGADKTYQVLLDLAGWLGV